MELVLGVARRGGKPFGVRRARKDQAGVADELAQALRGGVRETPVGVVVEEGVDAEDLVGARGPESVDRPAAEGGRALDPGVLDAVLEQQAGDAGRGQQAARILWRRRDPGRPRIRLDGRQQVGDPAIVGGEACEPLADRRAGLLVEGVDLVGDLERGHRRERLRFRAFDIGFERVGETAVAGPVGLESAARLLSASSGRYERQPMLVEDATGEPDESGGPFDHGVGDSCHGPTLLSNRRLVLNETAVPALHR